jgi:hypothetical protein
MWLKYFGIFLKNLGEKFPENREYVKNITKKISF